MKLRFVILSLGAFAMRKWCANPEKAGRFEEPFSAKPLRKLQATRKILTAHQFAEGKPLGRRIFLLKR